MDKIIKNKIAEALLYEKDNDIKKGLYEFTIVKLTYESNKIEGSTVTLSETSELYNKGQIAISDRKWVNLDEMLESRNHFKAFDFILENWDKNLNEKMIKKIHFVLFEGTHLKDKNFNIGKYKKRSNTIGSIAETAKPSEVSKKMAELLEKYKKLKNKTIYDIIDFHYDFEKIHPFQDGNGRVGRLVMFKECLKEGIVPFIVSEEKKAFYIRGLSEYENEKGFLRETCLYFQDELVYSISDIDNFKSIIKFEVL